jgi:hypothetical protein
VEFDNGRTQLLSVPDRGLLISFYTCENGAI